MRIRFNAILPWRGAFLIGLVAASLLAGGPGAVAEPLPQAKTQAGTHTVTGEVFDAQGEPLIGASVTVKGVPNSGAVCDIDGRFSIKAKKGDILVINYVGFKEQEVRVGDTPLVITMEENTSVLDEVVVVGYGVQKKATMTGSVAVVDEKALENKGTLSSPMQAIQGQVPGVIITRNSTAPGDES